MNRARYRAAFAMFLMLILMSACAAPTPTATPMPTPTDTSTPLPTSTPYRDILPHTNSHSDTDNNFHPDLHSNTYQVLC